MWYYAGLTLTDPSYVVQAFHDKLDIRYTTSEDQTTLENLEEGFYIDGDYTIKSCASADDNANYVYRDNCGPNRPLLDVWVTVGNDMTQAKNIRDNVPVFLYLLNGDHFSRPSVIKRSNRRRFGFGMTHTIKRNMPN